MGGIGGGKPILKHRGNINITVALEPGRTPNHFTKSSLKDEVSPPGLAALTGTKLPDLSYLMAHQSWNKSLKVN